MASSTISHTQRLPWLDASKAYGMFLVYYGHFVERVSDLQGFIPGTAAFAQYKLVYSFHMPLFFILSGYVYKEKPQRFWPFFRHRLLTRIVPAIFFNLIALAIYLAEGLVTREPGLPEYYQHRNLFWELLLGHPFGNVITWFLFCLFTVEMINYGLYPLLKDSRGKRAAIAAITIIGGHWITLHIDQLEDV
ncbi:MAG: acyltransferase family protein [Spirulina sp.]